MKPILLIFPKHSPFPHTVGFPLTLYSLGKYLEKYGFEVDYFDERIDKKIKLIDYLRKKPLFVGLSTITSYQIASSLKIAKLIRKFNSKLPLVWGGIHPSMMPIQTIKNKCVDYVVYGEGEETLKELIEYFLGKRKIETIAGLVWKKDNKIYQNKERKFLDYNKVPFPYNVDKTILKKYLDKDTNVLGRHPMFYASSRGCPFDCRFCYNRYFNRNFWRPRNIKIVKEELSELKKQGAKRILFGDDNIAVTEKHLLCICKIMKELNIKWGANIRVNYVTKEMAKILEESACDYLLIGIESGSQEMLRYMNKGITLEGIRRCVNALAKTKITCMYSFMFGFPQETKDHMEKSFNLVDWITKKDPKAEMQFQIYTPYPGTPMYEEAIKKGFKQPKSLEQWSEMVCDEVNVPWVKDKRLLRNLYVISVFAFRNKEFLRSKLFYIPHKIALLRWKHRFFKFSYERVIYDIIKKIPWLD